MFSSVVRTSHIVCVSILMISLHWGAAATAAKRKPSRPLARAVAAILQMPPGNHGYLRAFSRLAKAAKAIRFQPAPAAFSKSLHRFAEEISRSSVLHHAAQKIVAAFRLGANPLAFRRALLATSGLFGPMKGAAARFGAIPEQLHVIDYFIWRARMARRSGDTATEYAYARAAILLCAQEDINLGEPACLAMWVIPVSDGADVPSLSLLGISKSQRSKLVRLCRASLNRFRLLQSRLARMYRLRRSVIRAKTTSHRVAALRLYRRTLASMRSQRLNLPAAHQILQSVAGDLSWLSGAHRGMAVTSIRADLRQWMVAASREKNAVRRQSLLRWVREAMGP